jgi:hypothetical protein
MNSIRPCRSSLGTLLLASLAFILITVCSKAGNAAELKPNAVIALEFPELPPTYFAQKTHNNEPPRLSAQLPEDYTADRKFPLFVFLDGGNGGAGGDASFARRVVGPRGFIAVNLPLFKEPKAAAPTIPGLNRSLGDLVHPGDAAVLASSYRVMLEKLAQAVPNIATEGSTLGGFSNGAHATSVLAAARDEFLLQHFTSFVLLEGGIGLALNPTALSDPAMKGHRFLVLFGDHDKNPETQAQREKFSAPILALIEQQAKAAQLDLTSIIMTGYGHEQPPEYLKLIGAWTRGEKLPELPFDNRK